MAPAASSRLVIVVVGVLVMALVHLPKPAAMLRWPGITLMMGGGVCLIAGFVLNSTIPGRIRDAVTDAVYHSPDVPVTAMDLAGDLAESFTRQATAGFILPAVIVMAIGAALIAASLLSGSLPGAAGLRLLPGNLEIVVGGEGNRRPHRHVESWLKSAGFEGTFRLVGVNCPGLDHQDAGRRLLPGVSGPSGNTSCWRDPPEWARSAWPRPWATPPSGPATPCVSSTPTIASRSWLKARVDNSLERAFRSLLSPSLLILDDLGLHRLHRPAVGRPLRTDPQPAPGLPAS